MTRKERLAYNRKRYAEDEDYRLERINNARLDRWLQPVLFLDVINDKTRKPM